MMDSTVTFNVDSRYSNFQLIGKGTYGMVASAVDSWTHQKVAIKKVLNVFDDLTFAKRILREIRILSHFNHPNIIHLLDLQKPKSIQDFKDVYIITELMETDLNQIIKSKNAITDEHIQYFIYQILCALCYIHSADVLHRDLKPSNILLNKNCDLKLCDMGLARGVDKNQQDRMTEYVITRWYRPPELVLSLKKYSKPIDIWSVGVILAELILRKPLFPGENYVDQVNKIINFLGTPTKEEIRDMEISEDARKYLSGLEIKKKVDWKSAFPGANPLCLDLMSKMLKYSPGDRITAEEALKHPYLEELYDDGDLLTAKTFDFSFEKDIHGTYDVREMIYQQILKLHPDERMDLSLFTEDSTPDTGISLSPMDEVDKFFK